MENIIDYFLSRNLNIEKFLQASGLVIVVLLGLALASLLMHGKLSVVNHAVSSAIGILFIYAVTVVLGMLGPGFQRFVAPLPFVNIENDYMVLFNFSGGYMPICDHIVSMIVLAFLMNLVDSLLPVGKNPIVWILLRCLAVVVGITLHLVANYLFDLYLPQGLSAYAPVILLAVLALLLLTGVFKVVVGLFLTTVNPIIAAIYTFFFANLIGKQITKAVLTTGLLAGLSLWLQKMGICEIYIARAALGAYIPLILLLLVVWYVVGRLLSTKK